MTEIPLRFIPRFEEWIISGQKTATTRRSRHGSPGDTFKVWDRKFEIVAVLPLTFGELVPLFYRAEGYRATSAFRETLQHIYPGLVPSDMMYVHIFRPTIVITKEDLDRVQERLYPNIPIPGRP